MRLIPPWKIPLYFFKSPKYSVILIVLKDEKTMEQKQKYVCKNGIHSL